jgi:hypothetical protein
MAGGALTGVVEHTGTRPYERELRERILAALPPNPADMAEATSSVFPPTPRRRSPSRSSAG